MKLTMSFFPKTALGLVVLLAAMPTLATQPVPVVAQGMLVEKVEAIKLAAAANEMALHQYTWTQVTQLSLYGQVKRTDQASCRYGPDGTVQKTPLGAPPQQPQGALGQEIAAEVINYLEGVKGLIATYVPPQSSQLQQAFLAGNISINVSGGAPALVITNYAKPGDSETITIDPVTHKPSALNVNTYLSGPSDTLVLSVQFATLPDGTNYASQVNVVVASKNMQITQTNLGYQKTQ